MSVAQGPLSSIAFCWRIERRDGAGLGLTSHDEELVVGGLTYRAAPGILVLVFLRALGIGDRSLDGSGIGRGCGRCSRCRLRRRSFGRFGFFVRFAAASGDCQPDHHVWGQQE